MQTLNIETARRWYPAQDPVHGFDHILRVLRLGEQLARAEGADVEIVGAAALLHDAETVERSTFNVQRITHHHSSAEIAKEVLTAEGWPAERIAAVQHCIRAHRFRHNDEPPATLEAQVLFDADKLDAIGVTGVARAVAYAAARGIPAFVQPSEQFRRAGQLADGELHSAYHEFLFKLSRIRERLYTPTGRLLAAERHDQMTHFFEQLALECAPPTFPE